MPRFPVITAAALMLSFGYAAAHAGDFVPRATSSYAAVCDDSAAHSATPDVGSAAAMNESEPVAAVPGQGAAHASPTRNAKHIGVDDAASDVHPAVVADADDKLAAGSAASHKQRGALRWQSLLPGVMK